MSGLDTETRAMVAHTLERFVAEHYDPAQRLKRLHARPVDYRAHWPLLADLGLFGLLLEAEQGGLGGGAADLAKVLLALAPGLVLEPVGEALIGNALFAAVCGDGDADAVAQAAAGQGLWVAVNPAPSQWLRAQHDGDTLRLRGTLTAVPYAAQADHWLVAAVTPAGERRVLSLSATHPGVRVEPFKLMDGRPAADLHFTDVDVDDSAARLPQAAVAHALAQAADRALVSQAADAVGIMEHLLSLTRSYLRTRVQFGVSLGSFQALQHRLADMHMAFLESRGLLRALTDALDSGQGPERLIPLRCALARVVLRSGRRVGQEAIQLHGGMGLTEELVVSHGNARLQVIAGTLNAWVDSGTHEHIREAA